MPVGTLGAVKGLGPDQLEEAGAAVMLANLYHLSLRPGIDAIERVGGLHRFCGWSRALGDRQRRLPGVLALRPALGRRRRRRLQEPPRRQRAAAHAGVGGRHAGAHRRRSRHGARRVPAVAGDRGRGRRRARPHHRLGAPRPRARTGAATALFGIVQGSIYPRLRQRAIEELEPLDFDGYAIGGVAVGEGSAQPAATWSSASPRRCRTTSRAT